MAWIIINGKFDKRRTDQGGQAGKAESGRNTASQLKHLIWTHGIPAAAPHTNTWHPSCNTSYKLAALCEHSAKKDGYLDKRGLPMAVAKKAAEAAAVCAQSFLSTCGLVCALIHGLIAAWTCKEYVVHNVLP
eukprot:scaffold30820_cov19-Tisochrysis_lutea.AAC.2